MSSCNIVDGLIALVLLVSPAVAADSALDLMPKGSVWLGKVHNARVNRDTFDTRLQVVNATDKAIVVKASRRAISVAIARPDSAMRCGSESYPRSAVTRCGLCSGAPGSPRTFGMASISGSSCVTS
jgi:hypothetical protein